MTHDLQKTHDMMYELRACELYISECNKQWPKVAGMFYKIREERLYEVAGYDSFEKYAKGKWNYRKADAHQIANFGLVRTLLLPVLLRSELARLRGVEDSAFAENDLLAVENHARTLNKFKKDPAKMVKIWEETKKTTGKDQPTQLEVEAVIKTMGLSKSHTTKRKPLTSEMKWMKILLIDCGQAEAELTNEYLHLLCAKPKITRKSLPAKS